jgi:transposase
VYGIPVWNILETYKFELMLVNAAIVRALQGRKTDSIDARRVAGFLRYDLLRGSFIPRKPVRQMRELTRMRVPIPQGRNRVIDQIGRLLETVNSKLGSVGSHIVGKSGRAILDLLAAGSTDAARMADKALGPLKIKTPEFVLALEGRTDEHLRWMLTRLPRELDALGTERAGLDQKTAADRETLQDLIERLSTIPGIEKTTARTLISEWGADMSQFPDAAHQRLFLRRYVLPHRT